MRWVQADFPQRDFILKMEMKSEDHQFDALEEIKYVLQSVKSERTQQTVWVCTRNYFLNLRFFPFIAVSKQKH